MKTVLITGASSGIGAKACEIFSENGYEVLLLGRNRERLTQVSKSLKSKNQYFCVDLNNPAEVNQFCVQFLKNKPYEGELCALVNNAGIVERKSIEATSAESLRRQFQVNFFSVVELTTALGPALKKSPTSFVVNIASTLGEKPITQTSAYSASKAALINWSKCLALEWAKEGVRVNIINPGIIDTPIHEFHKESPESDVRKMVDSAQPIGRVGKPEEIAQMIYFLTQPQSEWTTGSVFTIDGGIQLL